METVELRVAPKNNTNVLSDINDDMTVCKYITYFIKRDSDSENVFPGKPSEIKKIISKNIINYTYKQKYYTKDGTKLTVVRDTIINASIVNKNGTFQLDIKFNNILDKKDSGTTNNIIIKKQNIVDILVKIFEQKK